MKLLSDEKKDAVLKNHSQAEILAVVETMLENGTLLWTENQYADVPPKFVR